MGEDVTFCIRAAAAGHQPHVDLGLICGHQGSKIYGQPSMKTAEEIKTLIEKSLKLLEILFGKIRDDS